MEGIDLKKLSANLHPVAQRYNKKPALAIRNTNTKLGKQGLKTARYYGTQFNFRKDYHKLPLKAFDGFSFDELCKLRYSSVLMMDETVEHLFKNDKQYRVIFKIKNSMWKWGCGSGTWNEIVEAYDGIRAFTISDNPDFELRLDYTTGCNEFGYSEFNRSYIDGVFAYLVYYKQKHVMTIGFSILEDRKILIQQVQSAQRAGNRYLYKLPSNRLELVIEAFRRHFPSHELYLVEGGSLVNKTIASYRRRLDDFSVRSDIIGSDSYRLNEERRTLLEEMIHHIEVDRNRITALYSDTGKFSLGQAYYVGYGLNHQVLLP